MQSKKMIKKFSTKFIREDTVNFIIDNDRDMGWIGSFSSNNFNRFFVLVDREVEKIWGNVIRRMLSRHGKEMFFFVVESSEHNKSLGFYPTLVNFFESHICNLSDLVIAIGGGVIIDLVSFTVSTYMRGLSLITIPTTLIGQIDASTAGKTCLNTEKSKNVLGTFYYPLISYNNIHFLKTNSKYYSRQGYSEIFKYGLLGCERLVRLLEKYKQDPPDDILAEIIYLAIQTRVKIRKKHPLASNLGHTFGHAIEKMSSFNISHGDAISVGIVVALYFAEEEGIIKQDDVLSIMELMKKIGLNIYLDTKIDVHRWVDLIMRDKKSFGKDVNLVLVQGIAKPYRKKEELFFRTSLPTLERFLIKFVKDYKYKVDNCAKFIKKEHLAYKEH